MKNAAFLCRLSLGAAALLAIGTGLGLGCRAAPERGRPPAVAGVEDEPWADPKRVVANINGFELTQAEFYRRVLRQLGTARVLAGVIQQEIVLQEAEKRGIKVTQPEVNDKVDEIMAEEERQAGGAEALRLEYEKVGLTIAEMRRDHEREVRTQLILSKLIRSLRRIDERVLQEYYKRTYAETRYQTRHIAYSFRPQPGQSAADIERRKMEAFNKAARAADRIRRGADFAEIARAESDDSVTAARGGDLEPVPNDDRLPEYMRAVLLLPVGEVSDPVENPLGGYHVFEVKSIIPSESYVDCKDKMRREILEREPTSEEVGSVLMALRKEADVQIMGSPIAAKPPAAQASMVAR